MTTIRARLTLGVLAGASALLLAGCDASRHADANIQAANTEAEVNYRRAREPLPTRVADSVLVSEDMWLGRSAFTASKGDPLPPDTDEFTFVSAVPQSVAQIVAEVTALTGIPTSLELVVLAEGTQGAPAGAPAAAPDGGADATLGAVDGIAPAVPVAVGPEGGPAGEIIEDINYSGTLAGFMDYFTSLIGADWTYDDGELRIFNQATRTFTIYAHGGAYQETLQAQGALGVSGGGGGDGGGGGGGGSQLSTVNQLIMQSQIDILNEVQIGIQSIIRDQGEANANPGTSTVTVTAPFFLMGEIEAYVEEVNKRLARQVTMDVRVLAVTVNEADDYRADIVGAITDQPFLDQNLDLRIGLSNLASVNGPVLFEGTLSDASETYDTLVNALSTLGEVSVVTSAALTTQNGRPVPLNNVREQEYIASVERETDQETGDVTVTVTRDILQTGFTMSITPRILGAGQVMVRYNANFANGNLIDLFQEPSTGAVVQSSDTQLQSVSQHFILNSNETVVVAGFERQLDTRDRAGVGFPGNFLLGGVRQAASNREFFVVLMTPRVQDFNKTFATLER